MQRTTMVTDTPRMSRMYMRQRQIKVAAITDFGDWLRRERSSRGLTMEMLSDRADTAPAVVSNLERGTRNPSRDMVMRMAAALAGQEADERTASALLNAGLKAAGFASADTAGPIETLMQEHGYSESDLSEEGHERLRQSLDAVIVGIVEQERQKRRLQ